LVVVWNKCDLLAGVRSGVMPDSAVADQVQVRTSALTGEGIEELRAAIVAAVAGPNAAPREAALLTNLRQHQAVQQSLQSLASAQAAVAHRIPHEMLLLDLYAALRALDALTGATTTDDVLSLIFSTFCIGK
jgi:tRNA modification GTPase